MMENVWDDVKKWGAAAGIGAMMLLSTETDVIAQKHSSPPAYTQETAVQNDTTDTFEDAPVLRLQLSDNLTQRDRMDIGAISDYTQDVSELLHYGADKLFLQDLGDDTEIGRASKLAAAAIPLTLLETPLTSASHEYGHFRSYSYADIHDHRFRDDEKDFKATPWSAYKMMFNRTYRGIDNQSASATDDEFDEWRDEYTQLEQNDWMTQSNADGLNQQQYNAAQISDKILDGDAHVLDQISLFANNLGTTVYPTDVPNSDITDYTHLLRIQEIDVDAEDVKKTEVPKLFSNSTLASLKALHDFVKTGDKKIDPLKTQIGENEIYWPEFASYKTARGPTVQFTQRLDNGNNSYTAIIEQTTTEEMELGLGYEHSTDTRTLETQLNYNLEMDGIWLEAGLDIPISDRFTAELDAFMGHGYSFQRDTKAYTPAFEEETTIGATVGITLDLPYR